MKKTECIFIPLIAISTLFLSIAPASGQTGDLSEDFTPAFRHPSISEIEFQARAQSFGVVPVATFLAKRISDSQEMESAIRAKTVAAQIEWLDSQGSTAPPSVGAIDALLEIEDRGDWTEEIQNVFFEFLVRKANLNRRLQKNTTEKTDPLIFRIAQHLKRRSQTMTESAMESMTGPAANAREQSDMILFEARKIAETMTPKIYKFADLPEDVSGVFVNGKWQPKSQRYFEIYFPPVSMAEDLPAAKIRLSFVSNLFQPKTLLISSSRNFQDLGPRQVWINPRTPCTVDFSAYHSKPVKIAVIGDETCEEMIGVALPRIQNLGLKQISNFGRSAVPLDPFRSTAPIDQPPIVRPWMWAAIGGVAVLAIAISARSRETQVQPTTNSGW